MLETSALRRAAGAWSGSRGASPHRRGRVGAGGLWLPDRHHGARRRTDYPLGDAADEQVLEPCSPVRAHHDGVIVLVRSELDDGLVGLSGLEAQVEPIPLAATGEELVHLLL